MSYKPKTRYIVSDRGKIKEIVAVREASKGDLRVLIRENPHARPHISNIISSHKPFHFPISERNKVLEQHISVHPPEKLINHVKIKRSTKTNEINFDSSVLCENFVVGYFVPVFLRLCGKLDSISFWHKADQRDRTVYLGGFDGSVETLIVSATITPAQSAIPLIIDFPWHVSTLDFSLYQFSVGCCRVAIPGLNFGQTAYPYSIAPRVNGESLFEVEASTMTSLTLASTRSWISKAAIDIRRSALNYVAVRNFPINDYDTHMKAFDQVNFSNFLPLLPML